jgi:diaminopimelate decarboxylase
VNVLLRINTREHAKSAAERMAGGPSRFGFDEENVVDQVREFATSSLAPRPSSLRLIGIQVYSASGVLDAGFICQHFDIVLGLALRLSRELGFPLRCIDFGGGLGVPYEEGEQELDLRRISRHVSSLLGRGNSGTAPLSRERKSRDSPQFPLADCRLILEIGRYLLAESGVYVTKVLRVKESRGERFAICDGGMNHFTRHAFMKTNHQIRVLNKMTARPVHQYHVCGPLCTPLDELGRCALPPIEEGDVIGVFAAGAYGYTMSLGNFLSFGWPAEVLVDHGKTRLIRPARKP